MKLFSSFLLRFHDLHRKEIFLFGYYISFLIIMTLAAILDTIFENYIDVYVEIFFIILTLLSMLRYYYQRTLMDALYSILIIAVLTTYALLLSNHNNISAFHSIVPLGFFLLFPLRLSLIYTLIHHGIVTLIFIYQYSSPDYPIVHDPVVLVSTELTSLMIIFFGIVYHFSIENSYHLLANSDKQKALLLKEVHHRVKNNLNIISSMLGLQMLKEEDPHVQEILEKNKYRIRSIALVHELLYQHNDFKRINIQDYLNRLSSTLLNVYDKDILVTIDGNRKALPFELMLRIGIITNEMIVNSIKYALYNKRSSIRMQLDEDETHFIYRYEDSSTVSIDISQVQKNTSLGLRLIDMMVKQMDAELDIKSDSGLIYTLWIPKNVY